MNPALKENKDFLHVLIIGNGFDLAHGLETRYTDFLDSCNNCNSSWFYYFQSYVLVNEIKKIDETIKTNTISNERYWYDFEEEIYNIVKNRFRVKALNKSIQDLLTEPHPFDPNPTVRLTPSSSAAHALCSKKKIKPEELVSILSNFRLRTSDLQQTSNTIQVIKTLDSQLKDGFVKEFVEYLSKQIEKLTQDPKPHFCLKKLKGGNTNFQKHTLWVLNFNYTPTFQKLYEPTLTKSGIQVHHCHIHGALGEGNLVLGCQSFTPDDKIDPAWNVFTKHHQRHRYGTIEKYQELLKELRHFKGEVAFHIIGHSLARADHAILKHALCSSRNTAVQDSFISVYYHDEEAHLRLINNITDMIGEEAVMARVRFIDQHDPERSILERIHETSKNQ